MCKEKNQRDKLWGTQAFLPARAGGPGKASVFRSHAALGSGKVWAGITRWHCYTVFQVLFLPVRVNVQSWQDRQRWSSLGSAGTGRGLQEWGWGGGEGRGQRPGGLVGLWVPKHLSDIVFCEQMTCLKQLSPCYAHLPCRDLQTLFTLVTSWQRRDFRTRLEEDKTGQHCLVGMESPLWDGMCATSQVAEQ